MSGSDRYHGFELGSVCWGYREIFARSIEGLFAEGLLGDGNEAVTATFFQQLQQADQSCYDHVLKEFLTALNPRTQWLLTLPGIFAEVTDLGHRFAEAKLYYGIHFFRLLGEGGYGDTPAQVRQLVTLAGTLMGHDAALAYAFLQGYRTMLERLRPTEIDLYVQEGIRLHRRGSEAGRAFLACTSKASETMILSITKECRLHDVKPQLSILLRALSGKDLEIGELSSLDADELIERGSRVVCLYQWLYLPVRLRHFEQADRNRRWYLLTGIAAAAMLVEHTFCTIHGHRDFPEPGVMIGPQTGRLNLFAVLEYVRALRSAAKRWPGCRNLIQWGLNTEFRERPPRHPAELLLQEALVTPQPGADAQRLIAATQHLCNTFDTVAELDTPWAVKCAARLADHGQLIRPFAFLPDLFFPVSAEAAPPDSLVADLKDQARQRREQPESADQEHPLVTGMTDPDQEDDSAQGQDDATRPACYWYPEWNLHENDYLDNWCGVHEPQLPPRNATSLPPDVTALAGRVSRIFERLRPTENTREKRLESGDTINTDRLVTHRVQRHVEPDPPVDFYEKPLTNRRDLAVLILLDVSGSTGADHGQRKVLDIEKHAALVLGHGLHLLGDRFAVSGFSSNGREQCEYYRYKSFEEAWGRPVIQRILAAYPRSSTRIGPALRHSAWLLAKVEARQRLIILVTDGQPMDSGYSPHTRYAQHDVRRACEENERLGIATYGISTEENSLADLEIMFPRRRFAVLPDISALPKVLPNLYLKLTF